MESQPREERTGGGGKDGRKKRRRGQEEKQTSVSTRWVETGLYSGRRWGGRGEEATGGKRE